MTEELDLVTHKLALGALRVQLLRAKPREDLAEVSDVLDRNEAGQR